MRSPDPRTDADPCLEPAELTAFAAGDLTEARRARVSRHLLRCGACRTRHDEASGLLGRLRAFGTTPGWVGDLEAATTAVRGERRTRRRASFAGIAAAALLATGLALAPGLGGPDVGPGTTAVAAADPAAEAALLRAQAADGRWSAAATDDDEAATGLALLALLAERPKALASPPVARAVADATRWLRTRQADDGGFGRGARSERGHALATEALLEVWAQTGDPGLRHALVPAVRRLATDAHGTHVDDATEWTRRALARAHGLGWRTPTDAPTTTSSSWTLPGAPQASQCARVLAFIAQ